MAAIRADLADEDNLVVADVYWYCVIECAFFATGGGASTATWRCGLSGSKGARSRDIWRRSTAAVSNAVGSAPGKWLALAMGGGADFR